MVEINVGQLVELLGHLFADVCDYEFKELFDEINVIDEDLKKVFDSHLLVALQSKLLVFLIIKFLVILGIVNERPGYLLDHV